MRGRARRGDRVARPNTKERTAMPRIALPQNTETIDEAEAGRLVGKTEREMAKSRRSGLIPHGCWWAIGRSIRYNRARLVAWMENGGSHATAA